MRAVIQQYANLPECTMPGYFQTLCVFDPTGIPQDESYPGIFLGSWSTAPLVDDLHAPRLATIPVQTVEVECDSVWDAFKQFHRYLAGEIEARRIN